MLPWDTDEGQYQCILHYHYSSTTSCILNIQTPSRKTDAGSSFSIHLHLKNVDLIVTTFTPSLHQTLPMGSRFHKAVKVYTYCAFMDLLKTRSVCCTLFTQPRHSLLNAWILRVILVSIRL